MTVILIIIIKNDNNSSNINKDLVAAPLRT